MDYRSQNRIKGAGTELVTPFAADGSVDAAALAKIVEASIESEMDFLCALGPVSEAAALSAEERRLVLETVREADAGRVPVLLGLDGDVSISKLSMMPESAYDGADAFLLPAAADCVADLALASPLPVFLYSDGEGILPETLFGLAAQCPKIVGVVVASGEGEHIKEILEKRQEGFVVLSGDDLLTCELMLNGADGAVSVAANAMPETEWLLVNSFSPEGAMHADMLMRPYIDLIAKEGKATGIKMMLSKMGIAENILREPLAPASEALQFDFNLLMK